MARHYTRGEGHIPPDAKFTAGKEKRAELEDKVQRTKEAQREKETNALLDRLIAKAGGVDRVQQMLDARRAEGKETKAEAPSILSDEQRAELAQGERDASEISRTHTEYKADPNHPDRVLSEMTTDSKGNSTRIDYTYDDAGNVTRKMSQVFRGGAKYQTTEEFSYGADGALTEEHMTKTVLRPDSASTNEWKDVLYVKDDDPRVQDQAALKELGRQFSIIKVKDADGAISVEYDGDWYVNQKDRDGKYVKNATNQRTEYSYDLRGRVKTKDRYDGNKLDSRYSYTYKDRPDGSYTKTRKDLTSSLQREPYPDKVEEYDRNGRIVAEQDYNGNQFIEYSYTADGNLAAKAQRVRRAKEVPNFVREGWTYTQYQYDQNGRVEVQTEKQTRGN